MISAKQLHEWYLQATRKLNPEAFNKNAQKPYEELTEELQFVDKYIAQRIDDDFNKIMDRVQLFLLQHHALLPTCKCRMCRRWRNFKEELRS